MTAHPRAFATAYRQHVVPRLARMVDVEAFFVALGSRTFNDAQTTVIHEALRLGAQSLTDEMFDDLSDWISAKLLSSTLAAEARIADMRPPPVNFGPIPSPELRHVWGAPR